MFALAACQEELQQPVEQPVVPGVEGELQEVTFSVNIPQDPQTKAISDGMKATNLEYAVYRAEAYSYTDETGKTETYPAGEYIPALSQGANAKITPKQTGKALMWEVVLTLAKNVKYDIVFWAYADDAPYTFDEEKATITVDDNYTGPANAENRDAFFFRCDDYAVITSDTKVELRRPFAQINFGSSDYDPYITDLHLKMTSTFDTDAHAPKDAVYENDDPNGRLLYPAVPAVGATKLPTVLNVLDGTVSGEAVVNFATTPIPYETGDQVLMVTDADGDETTTADQTTYHWMAMNYVLAGEEATIDNIHAVFTYNNQDLEINVPNVPFKRNYKTNIIGNLFTGEAKFNVIVVPDYYEPDYIYDMDLTLAEAFTQNRDVEFTMTENTVIEEPLILENGKTLTLNLDEYSITTETDLWDAANKVWSMISVRNGSTLVINSKGGKVVAKADDAYAIDVQGGSTVTINGGEYVGNISSVYVLEGTANINGGSYSIKQLSEPANGGDERFTLNCEDAAYKAGNAVINVTGGSFVNFDPSNNLAEGAGTDFLADGYKTLSEKDNSKTVYTVVELNPIEKAVAEGANTVVLSEDLVLDETIAVASELTIDLGGKALSTETTPAFLANADLTIKNGTANVAKELVRVGAGVTVTLDDVNATSEGDNCVFVPKESKDAAVVVAEGTSLTSKGAAAIQSNGNTEGLDLTIAGTVVSDGDVAVYLPQVEKCTVASTAEITGVTGIEIRAGELVVEDGAEISATENTLTAKANGNGSTVIGAAVAVSPHTTNLPITVTVEGGEFSCANSIYEINFYDDRTASTTLEVKGGTFNAPIYSENCTGFITGGTFVEAAKPEDKYLADDMVYDETTGEVVGVTLTVATVAEFLAAAENDTMMYELTGVITNVANTTYGNFDLTDETGTVYIYGLCSPEGAKKYWAESGAKLGDTITIRTIRTSFSGSPQGENAIFVELVPFVEEASEWGVVGDLTSWKDGSDITMYTTWKAENLFVAYNVEIASGAFKIRANNEWNDAKNYGLNVAGNIYADKYYAMTKGAGSQNITPMVYGTYDVYFDLANERVALVTPGKEYADAADGGDPVVVIEGLKDHTWGVIGSFAASNEWKVEVDMVVDGDWAVAKNVELANGNEFKFRADDGWALSYGSACDVNVGDKYTTYKDGGNMKFVGEAGAYNIYFSLVDAKFYMEKYTPETTVTFNVADYEFANQTALGSYTVGNVTIAFAGGGNSNSPKYYTSGTAVRCYPKNTITVSGKNIKKIEVVAPDGYTNAIDLYSGNAKLDNFTWEGSSDEVVLTFDPNKSSGQSRFVKINVTYE